MDDPRLSHNSKDAQSCSTTKEKLPQHPSNNFSQMMPTTTRNDYAHLSSFVPSTIASVELSRDRKRSLSGFWSFSASSSELSRKRMKREGQLLSKSTLELLDSAQNLSANQDFPFNHDPVRKQMLALIEKRLEQSKDSDGQLPSANLAQALEKHLYSTSTSLSTYSDQSTLNSRLRLITVALLRRRLQKGQRVERSDVLKTHLGAEKYEEVVELAKDIKMLRLNRIAIGCGSCPRSGPCESRPPSISAQKVMPMAVRNLFFNTYLHQAVETVPAERIPQLPWDMMIEHAKSNIKAYKEWNEHNEGSCDDESPMGFEITRV